MVYTYDYLKEFTEKVFIKMGCNREDATAATDVFLSAELRGISSHGMIRIKNYFQLWEAGRINVQPEVRVVHESPSTAVIDGDNGIGMIPSVKAMKKAISLANKSGTGWVATRHSNHYGIAGYYSMMAIEHDMIGICMTNANPLVAPTYSISRMLGTNPIAVAVPAGKNPPFVADFSTTPIARGKLAVAAKKGEKVPMGYVQDKDGNSSDDPDILKDKGSMLTLGGTREHGSHKGFCMSAIVDIFSGVLSGANFGPFVPPSIAYLPVLDKKVGAGTGHFFGAVRIDAFQPAHHFKAKMDEWIDTFKSAKSAPGKPNVIIPGEIERENEKRIMKEGIDVIPAVVHDLKEVAAKLGMSF
jgi:LDH2 family malate/lactate/ureidoglycolate dehydrogenase